MDLVEEVYRLVLKLPIEEKYSLGTQIRRAVVSVPSNIAEGNRRFHKKEYIQFLNIANGSIAELYTQLIICVRLGYFEEKNVEKSLLLIDEISKMLKTIIYKLKER